MSDVRIAQMTIIILPEFYDNVEPERNIEGIRKCTSDR